jgi:hypothetical protein
MSTVFRIWCGAHTTLSSDEGLQSGGTELDGAENHDGHTKRCHQAEHDPHRPCLAHLPGLLGHMLPPFGVKSRQRSDVRPVAPIYRHPPYVSRQNCVAFTAMRRRHIGSYQTDAR